MKKISRKQWLPLLIILLVSIWLISAILCPKKMPESLRYCDKDDDCILVQDGCCSCTMGGKNTAINKVYLEWWDNKIFSECKEIACPAVISNDPTCFSEPKCVNGECKPVPK